MENSTKPQPGDHVFGVKCRKCSARIVGFPDQSNGTKPIKFAGEGRLEFTCEYCGIHKSYKTSEVFRFVIALAN